MSVVLCSWGEAIERGAEEALTAARGLSAAAGLTLDWVVLGGAAQQAAEVASRHGLAAFDVIADPKLAGFGPDVVVEALSQYCARTAPTLVLCNQTEAARLVAPRLAARLGAAVVTNALALEFNAGALLVTASAFGGDTHVVYRMASAVNVACLVTTTIAIEQPPERSNPVRRQVDVDLAAVEERFRVVSEPKSAGPRLEDAEVIVSGGRGLGNARNFELVKQLAAVLGGMWAGSRVIVDDGWIDSSRQVGLTGKIARPRLYVAVGISGASQHMAGCSAAKTIVAINRDRDASIFRYARYGIVADCLDVLPELIKAAGA